MKKRAQKLGHVLLAFILAFSFCPIAPSNSAMANEGDATHGSLTAGSSSLLTSSTEGGLSAQANATVTSWDDLQSAINDAANEDVITLNADITADEGNETLVVERDGISFTIDLAGHTIDRNLKEQDDDNKGHVFDVNQGKLTIKDSSDAKTGKIKGGYDESGGGIVIGGDGHLVVESGIITGNKAKNGAGIFVYGKLTMTGGSVTDNASDAAGGGIFGHSSGTITLTSCSLTANTAQGDGGGICTYGTATLDSCTLNANTAGASGGGIRVHGGTTTLENGTKLEKNKATELGGGIYINNDGKLNLLSGSFITENTGYQGGGGVYVAGKTQEVQVGSGVKVTNNHANNIYLTNGKKLTVTERLAEGTAIGVGLESISGTFTTGYMATNVDVDPNSVFVADPGYSVLLDANGEARVVTSDWIELQAMIDKAAESGEPIELDRSWKAADENTALVIPAGKQIAIDLNGYTIDRHRSSYTADGEVFIVNGGLSLVDNTFDKKGAVKGGYGDAGGIRVNSGGKLELQSGTIAGNHAKTGGGGVCVLEGGTLETFGGSISGNISDADGGGVHNAGTFANASCAISNNKAGASGGGVYNAGEATFNTGTVSSNKANASGGGVYLASGTLTVNDGSTPVSISSNTAQGDGGGLYAAGGAATFASGEVKGNSAGGYGGGVYIPSAGSVTLQDGIIAGNYASYDGGGVYVDQGMFSVSGAPQVTQNSATIGWNILLAKDSRVTIGGALTATDSSKAHLDVITLDPSQALTSGFSDHNCDITCFTTNDTNQSQLKVQDGELYITQAVGGMRVSTWGELKQAVEDAETGTIIVLDDNIVAGDGDKSFKVEDGKSIIVDLNGYTINRNLTESDGGDGHIFNVMGDSTLTIQDSVGTGLITGGYADNGGAIYVHEGSTVNLNSGTIMGNHAKEDGGGIYVRGTLNTNGGAIVRNIADDNGGGIYAERNGSLGLKQTVISDNTSGNEGGGLDIRVSTASIENCQIRNNVAQDDDGGGINIDRSNLLLALTSTDIVGNASNGGHKGGGVFLNGGRIDVNGGSISGNSADDGGGIYNDECAVTLDGVSFSGNRTDEHGGAGISNHGSAQLSNCTFSGNVSNAEGGGVYTGGDDYFTATNCTFENNESSGSSGGGICTYRATTLTSCTFTGNKAHDSAGAVCIHGDTTIDGGTISGNEATEYGGGIRVNKGGTLRLAGTTSKLMVAGNTASVSGGGVYVAEDAHYVSLAGNVTVLNNEADNDFFIAGDKCVELVGPIEGSQIRVLLERVTGAFTVGYKACEPASDPAVFFSTSAGCAVIPTGNGEAQVVASDWSMLQAMIDAAQDGDTITLERDWVAAPQNAALNVPASKGITINLNGHTIDRARSKYEDAGEVFHVYGSLIVTGASEGAAGTICGGYGDGGGVLVKQGGALTLAGGNISGNKAKTGGGVLVEAGGTLNMTGGTIAQNRTDGDGGGVYSSGTANVQGGTITANDADGSGGGMWVAGGSGLNVSGSPSVAGNIAAAGSNLMLAEDVAINVTGALNSGARIDLVTLSPAKALTTGLSASGSSSLALDVFTYAGASGRLEVRDNELYLKQAPADVTVSDWQALQDAINADANQGKVIQLANDITADKKDDRLLFEGKNVIVDLNGHMLNRNLDDDDSDGHVFELSDNSSLTIQDSAGTGIITGGYAEHGGAINIHEGSTCTVEGGTFMGNQASDEGGAFYVYGTLIMTGGVITQNSTESGGGIFVDENGTIDLKNVAIVKNQAEKWGGGAINNKGNATLTDCIIKRNWADNEGGGIYNGEKQLTLENCTITDNSSSGGGGLCCFGTVDITDTTISGNYGDDYGGGLFMRGAVTISGGTIANNVGKDNGGGIYNKGGQLTVANATFTSNSTEAGGGALNNEGMATLTSCTLTGNRSDKGGGCIYESTDGTTNIDGCTLTGNAAGYDGGAIAACGIMSIVNSTMSENTSDMGGAGVYSYGDTTIANTTIEKNTAKESGGGLLSRKKTLTLDGVTVSENSAKNLGGGLMVESGSGDVIVTGAVTIKNNEGSGDVYLNAGKLLTVGGALENGDAVASIGVRPQYGVGVVFTSGYANYNPDKDPATYFASNDGYLVYLEGDEASTKKETLEDNPFIDFGSQINYGNGQLTSVNWMSGISGERRLNEINMPGTHDSGTKVVKGNLSTGQLMDYVQMGGAALGALIGFGTTGLAAAPFFALGLSAELADEINKYCSTFANCQTRYIDEQLEDGVRHLDIRVNTYYVEPGWPPKSKQDDGENLYLCHGKVAMTGTFYAYDERTSEYITFKRVIEWVKTFLEEHPTETIMMNVQVESVDDVQDEGIARVRKHLYEELATQINPSTGKPYLYMEDGVFGKVFSAYPQLKDCRGQVVLDCGDGDAEILGGLKSGVGLDSVERPDGSYKDNAETKIRNLRRFFADHGYNDLPAAVGETIKYLYSVGTNGTDSRSLPEVTPLEIADKVLDVLFGEDGLLLNKEGKYIGLINMDGANAENCKIVWSSNFFNTLEYCTVTVKSGFEPETVKTYTVEYGTKIPIPECIYNNPNSEGKYFQNWQGTNDNSISGITWLSSPGETFVITGDTTFTAMWGEQNTPVKVMWNDAENKDNLRPTSLAIKVKQGEGSETKHIEPSKNWRLSLSGDVKPADITVDWSLIGEDTAGKYKCEVRENKGGLGVVIEMTHTPQETVQAKGTIQWIDKENASGKRPQNVTVHLRNDEGVIKSATVTAEDGWTWDFGEYPAYVNGKKVTYSVEEDTVEDYVSYAKDFEITNVLGGTKVSTEIAGKVYWADKHNAGVARPDEVTINLVKNGETIATQAVSEDGAGQWLISFVVEGEIEDGEYTVTEDAIDGYTYKAYFGPETGGSIIVINSLEDHVHTLRTESHDVLQPTCTQDGLRMTVEYCEKCGEVTSSGTEAIPALGHEWGVWHVMHEPTAESKGVAMRTCARNVLHVQFRVLPETNHVHSLVHAEEKAATCTEDGNIEYWRCEGGDDACGLYFTDETAMEWVHEEAVVRHATGHDWGEWTVVQKQNEVLPGIEKRVCANDATHVQFRLIPKAEHVHGLVHVEEKAATCTEDGNIEYWRCAEGDDPCGLRFTDEKATQWVHQEGTVVHAFGHEWGAWETVKRATEIEPGLQQRVCSHDASHVQYRIIPKTGHVHSLVKVEAKAPTCTQEGNIEYWQCSDESCGLCYKDAAGGEWVAKEDTVLAALGHEWGEATYKWNSDNTQVTATHTCLRDAAHSESETVTAVSVTYIPPTCTTTGKTQIIPQLFQGEGFMPQVKAGADVPALGHEWGEWVVVKPATETEEGLEQRTCARCGEVETRAVPAEVSYRYVGPDGLNWTKGASDALTLTFKRSIDDGRTFGLFTGVEIDGVAVPEKDASDKVNYTAESGSLVLKLQPSFLETLSTGDHNVEALFEDGSGSATFTVKAAPSKDAATKSSSAKTGDALPFTVAIALAALAALAFAVLLIARRKRE